MPSRTSMHLDLRTITGSRDRVRRAFSGARFSEGADGQYRVADTVTLDLDVRKDGSKVRMVGRLVATLELGCCRCLEAFRLVVSVAVDVLYLPASDNTGDADVQIEESDLGTAYYRDDQIDVGHMMREQLQLALPMKPLCRDDCKGLCAVCGGDRNTAACECVERWVDPRLAVLKGLLKG